MEKQPELILTVKQWLILFGMSLLISFLSYGLVYGMLVVPLLGILCSIFEIFLNFCFLLICYNLVKYRKFMLKETAKDLVKYPKHLFTVFLQSLFLCLWAIIPIVGTFIAIYKAVGYSLSNYVTIDSKFKYYGNEAITISRELSKQRKMKIFLFLLPTLIAGIIFLLPLFGNLINDLQYISYRPEKIVELVHSIFLSTATKIFIGVFAITSTIFQILLVNEFLTIEKKDYYNGRRTQENISIIDHYNQKNYWGVEKDNNADKSFYD